MVTNSFCLLSSEEEESLPVGNGIWTRLLDVLQLKFEDLNFVFSSSTTFETNVLFLVILSYYSQELLSISLLKTYS